jgi:uncharacterized protein
MTDIKIIAMNVQLAMTSGQNLPSPCISVCQMNDASGWCIGCLRTLDEIAAWGSLDEPARRAVWRRIGERADSMAEQE